jgi:hypothetical protein
MLASTTKTPTNISSKMHQQLEGEAIIIKGLLEMDIPP